MHSLGHDGTIRDTWGMGPVVLEGCVVLQDAKHSGYVGRGAEGLGNCIRYLREIIIGLATLYLT